MTKGNCELVEVVIRSHIFSDMTEVTKVELNPRNVAITNLEIVVPCIRNTEKIAAGKELVLRWGTKDGKMDYIKWCPRSGCAKRVSNALDLDEQAPSPKKCRM